MRIRLMSNNQWLCDQNQPYWKERGLDCSAAAREPGFAAFYQKTEPDAIGLQEVSPLMLEKLMLSLQRLGLPYGVIWGRDTPILYRTDRLEAIDSAFLIYPRQVPGLDGEFNNHESKSYAAAVFRAKENGKLYALTECGYKNIPDSTWWTRVLQPIVENYSVSYLLPWRNYYKEYFAPDVDQVSAADFKKFYEAQKSLFLKDIQPNE